MSHAINSNTDQDFIYHLTEHEFNRQKNTISLIASENVPSPKVIDLLGGQNPNGYRSLWSNKYGEGYPGKRYYAGNEYTDQLEAFVQQKALEVYGQVAIDEYAVNLQMNAGSMANQMVYLSMLEYGDSVVSLNVANGGHISHMHSTSAWTKFFKYENYDLKEVAPNTFEIDFEDYCEKIVRNKPKLVIIGCSSYPREIRNYKEMIEFAHDNGAMVLCDIAHINGLVAAGVHATPFLSGRSGADFVSMTTHKTFRGPRAAMLYFKKEYADKVNKTVFPGTSGGPHFNKIAAIGQACLEILGEETYPDGVSFLDYSKNVLRQTKLLENTLVENGVGIISPTETHLMLAVLPQESDSLKVQKALDSIGIVCNRNGIPFETKSMWKPSGLRLGMAPASSRGITDAQTVEMAKVIADLVLERDTNENLKAKMDNIISSLNWWY
jgi:glycine hydroxymethyltransferase